MFQKNEMSVRINDFDQDRICNERERVTISPNGVMSSNDLLLVCCELREDDTEMDSVVE